MLLPNQLYFGSGVTDLKFQCHIVLTYYFQREFEVADIILGWIIKETFTQ